MSVSVYVCMVCTVVNTLDCAYEDSLKIIIRKIKVSELTVFVNNNIPYIALIHCSNSDLTMPDRADTQGLCLNTLTISCQVLGVILCILTIILFKQSKGSENEG